MGFGSGEGLLLLGAPPGPMPCTMSLPVRFEFWTPKSGPAGVKATVGGKCGATMNAAVVLEKAFWSLLRAAAVRALAIA